MTYEKLFKTGIRVDVGYEKETPCREWCSEHIDIGTWMCQDQWDYDGYRKNIIEEREHMKNFDDHISFYFGKELQKDMDRELLKALGLRPKVYFFFKNRKDAILFKLSCDSE